MGTRFSEFMKELRREAASEGPEAVAELRHFHERFRLARQLAEARKSRGLTQQDLATTTGLNQSEISNIESGGANPTYRTLETIASALGGKIALVLPARRATQGNARGRNRTPHSARTRRAASR